MAIGKVRDSSLDAYTKLREYLGESQINVYKYIKENPFSTRKEISVFGDFTINNVCGRVKELIDLGLVKESKRRDCEITKNNVYTVYALENIDYSLLELKKLQKQETIKLNKKHLPTIQVLLKLLKNKVGGDLKVLKEHGINGFYEAVEELEQEFIELNDSLFSGEPFLYQDLGHSLIFKVQSESREIFFNVEYNKLNKYLMCDCEDYQFRGRKCKHMDRVINKYYIEVKT